jgi:hypothetical protein
VSKALLSWIVAQGIGTVLIEPGKPWQNGVAESFNGTFRDGCLSLEWFRSRAEAKLLIEELRRHFNEVRPHSSLGYSHAERVRGSRSKSGAPPCNGRDAAVCGASVPRTRCSTVPAGTNAASKESPLKLAVVRKIWARSTAAMLLARAPDLTSKFVSMVTVVNSSWRSPVVLLF